MSQPTEFVLVPRAALDWLNGSGPDANGHWFGDAPDDNPKGHAFWWRTKFSAMLAASPSIPEGEVSNLVARLSADVAVHKLTGNGGMRRVADVAEAAALLLSQAAQIERLESDNASLKTKVEMAQYAMDTVARFVRPRIPEGQDPEQATSFLAWIGMIVRLEERGDKATARADTAEASLLTLQQELDRLREALSRVSATAQMHTETGKYLVSVEAIEAVDAVLTALEQEP